MKKTIMTLAIVLGLSVASFAQGGLFQRGNTPENNNEMNRGFIAPGMPNSHGLEGNQDAPLGTGIALLTAFGAAYLVGKRRKED